ncbi:MAG: hypothetical protein ACRDTE_29510 [Pseudonocardiaceae bacterium]
MGSRGPSVHQTSHHLICEALGGVLRSAVDPRRGDRGVVGSVPGRAVVALYMLVMAHPVDRRGRCRSCRRPGAVFGWRWRHCRVYGEASVWLHQSAEFVGVQVARELGLAAPRPGPAGEESAEGAAPSADADATLLPRIVADRDHRPTTPQSPAVPHSASLPGGSPQAGRPVPDHGGAGEPPTYPRSRRAPPDDHSPPDPDSALLLSGGAPCPA